MKTKKRRIPFLIRLVLFCTGLFVIAFAFLFGYLLWSEYSIKAETEHVGPIIVLGAQVQADGTPSVQLEWRLDKALSEYQKEQRLMVVCGAQGLNEPATEASVMRDWLVARGVPSDYIMLEADSFTTKENIENAMRLLPEGTKEITIVTSDYHLPRAMAIARDLGLRPSGIGSPIKMEYWLKNHTRETMAWGKYFLNKMAPGLID